MSHRGRGVESTLSIDAATSECTFHWWNGNAIHQHHHHHRKTYGNCSVFSPFFSPRKKERKNSISSRRREKKHSLAFAIWMKFSFFRVLRCCGCVRVNGRCFFRQKINHHRHSVSRAARMWCGWAGREESGKLECEWKVLLDGQKRLHSGFLWKMLDHLPVLGKFVLKHVFCCAEIEDTKHNKTCSN